MKRISRLPALLVVLLPALAAGQDASQPETELPGPVTDGLVVTDTERVPLFTTVPKYPKLALRDRIEGEVEVCFDVDRAGRPSRIAVRRSTHRLFEKPSIRAVRASRYEPVPRDQALSGIKTCRTFTFSLQPPEQGDNQEL